MFSYKQRQGMRAFAHALHVCWRVCKCCVYRYASRKRYPTFLDYFRASSSPFDSHGSPLLDYKLQLPLQRLLHRNAHERETRQYQMKLRRISYHMHTGDQRGKSERDRELIATFFKYFILIILFRRNKCDCIRYGFNVSNEFNDPRLH